MHEKTNCKACDREILLSTARDTGGFCRNPQCRFNRRKNDFGMIDETKLNTSIYSFVSKLASWELSLKENARWNGLEGDVYHKTARKFMEKFPEIAEKIPYIVNDTFGSYPRDIEDLCVYDDYSAYSFEWKNHAHKIYRYNTIYFYDPLDISLPILREFIVHELGAWEAGIGGSYILTAESEKYLSNEYNFVSDLYRDDARIYLISCNKNDQFWLYDEIKGHQDSSHLDWIMQTTSWKKLQFHKNKNEFIDRNKNSMSYYLFHCPRYICLQALLCTYL